MRSEINQQREILYDLTYLWNTYICIFLWNIFLKNHRKRDLTCGYPEVGGQGEGELGEGNQKIQTSSY